jgi:hypothetical protein
MYCRQCHYDLRSLTTNRCPECGKAFDPNNPDSFYSEYPSLGMRAGIALESAIGWRGVLFVILCFAWFGIVLFPSLSLVHGPPGSSRREQQLSQILLTSIMATWLDQQKAKSPSSTFAFDKQAAAKTLRRGVSPWTDQALRQRRAEIQDWLETGQIFAVLFVPPLALIAVLWRGKARRVAAVPLSMLLLVGLVSVSARQLSALLVPGTHAYLDDYVYLCDIDLLHPTGKIAAYDLPSSRQGRYHVVAFDDGHVEILDYVRAQALFEQQSIPYPEPKPPTP